MRTSSRPWLSSVSALVLGILTLPAAAAPLPDFTGYTRIGWPPTNRPLTPKEAELAKKAEIGVTVYFMVLDREKKAEKVLENDTWGMGIKDFDLSFVTSKTSPRDKIHREARYLYLYLLIDPRLITSYGYFASRDAKGKGVKGISFALPFEEKGAVVIRPLSTDFPGVRTQEYTSPAPARRAPRPYDIQPIDLLGPGEKPIAGGLDSGKEPDEVTLLANAYFGDAPDPAYIKPKVAAVADVARFNAEGMRRLVDASDAAARDRIREELRTRSPALHVVFPPIRSRRTSARRCSASRPTLHRRTRPRSCSAR